MSMTILCFLNTLLMAAGQILFKYGAADKKLDSVGDVFSLFFTPVIFFALCLYAAATGLWLYILSRVPINFAYPIQALAFPLVLIVSIFLFKESIPIHRWVGVAIICFGVFITTRNL